MSILSRKKILLSLSVIAVFSGSLLLGCASAPPPSLKGAVSIMTYNVENLFDTEDDPRTVDETFLPLSKKTPAVIKACKSSIGAWRIKSCLKKNWTQSVVQRKLSRIADVIKNSKEGGPEVIIFQEVENRFVVEELRKKYLKGYGYRPTLHIDGPDRRGIDTAVLTKLPSMGRPRLFGGSYWLQTRRGTKTKKKITRGILRTTLKLPDGSPLYVFGVHLPSQGSPSSARLSVIKQINQAQSQLPQGAMAVVGGDFNITASEEYRKGLFKKILGKHWLVSHELGCKKCRGTYYYSKNKAWSFLDALLFTKNMKSVRAQAPWVVLPESVRIVSNSLYQLNRWGSPAKYREGRSGVGVSDHLPLIVDILPRAKALYLKAKKGHK